MGASSSRRGHADGVDSLGEVGDPNRVGVMPARVDRASELTRRPGDAPALEHRARELARRAGRDELVEKPLIGFARGAHERERRGPETQLKKPPPFDGAVVVIALLLGLGENLDFGRR